MNATTSTPGRVVLTVSTGSVYHVYADEDFITAHNSSEDRDYKVYALMHSSDRSQTVSYLEDIQRQLSHLSPRHAHRLVPLGDKQEEVLTINPAHVVSTSLVPNPAAAPVERFPLFPF